MIFSSFVFIDFGKRKDTTYNSSDLSRTDVTISSPTAISEEMTPTSNSSDVEEEKKYEERDMKDLNE